MDKPPVPSREGMLKEVLEGLRRSQKRLPSKFFYDERGSRLFEKITALEEYYPTRTEMSILKNNIGEITTLFGKNAVMMELGSGSSKKTRLLLDHLDQLAAYIPVDISKKYLMKVSESLQEEYRDLSIYPVCADYTKLFALPEVREMVNRRVAFYPGSTIGNFEKPSARQFLGQIADIIGPSGRLLIGVDLKKDPEILEAAYNDRKNITAEFNKNILRRLNRELNAEFEPDLFCHNAFYNEEEGRIEMHLVSRKDQNVKVDGELISFDKDESIHTENSYKYSLDEFHRLVDGHYRVEEVWKDENDLFSLQYLEVRG